MPWSRTVLAAVLLALLALLGVLAPSCILDWPDRLLHPDSSAPALEAGPRDSARH
jgi:hypothetical protein